VDSEDRVILAELVRPRGNRGELLAISQTDVPGRLETLSAATVRCQDGTDFPVRVEKAWPHDEFWVLKFAGVDSINAAERFRKAELWVPRSERAQLPDGQWFRTDLVGCKVVEVGSDEVIGEVAGWQQYGAGPPLLELNVGGREVLIPFVPEICPEVDSAARLIRAQLPSGLLEL
jgi:16S rRNA processing protein RimM